VAWKNLLEFVYPVGSVYFSTVNDSPVKSIGGTWQVISGLNLGLPTKSYGYDNGFEAFQLGNVVFFTGFGVGPWEISDSVYHNDSLPESDGANGGAIYSQDSDKSVWCRYDADGNLVFENKNSSDTTNWYYGTLIYKTVPESAVTNNLGIYAWKRTA
jgi:hypothetical protein